MRTTNIRIHCFLLVIASATTMSVMSPLSAAPQGKPDKNLKGLSIWADEDGKTWHIKTHTKSGAFHKFAGRIEVGGSKITGATGIDKLERGDSWKIDFATNTVNFSLNTKGGWDTVNMILTRRPKTVTYDIHEDGQPMNPERIHLGHDNHHPTRSHFTIPGK